jgi:hypothetical protein
MDADPRSDYHRMRARYTPAAIKLKLVIIAESPPASGEYFYNPKKGKPGSEWLFNEISKQAGLPKPTSKDEGLRALQEHGWLLVEPAVTGQARLSS